MPTTKAETDPRRRRRSVDSHRRGGHSPSRRLDACPSTARATATVDTVPLVDATLVSATPMTRESTHCIPSASVRRTRRPRQIKPRRLPSCPQIPVRLVLFHRTPHTLLAPWRRILEHTALRVGGRHASRRRSCPSLGRASGRREGGGEVWRRSLGFLDGRNGLERGMGDMSLQWRGVGRGSCRIRRGRWRSAAQASARFVASSSGHSHLAGAVHARR